MTKRLKQAAVFLAAAALMLSVLLYLPSDVSQNIGFGIMVSAEETESGLPGDTDDTADDEAGKDSGSDPIDEGSDEISDTANHGSGDLPPVTNKNDAALFNISDESAASNVMLLSEDSVTSWSAAITALQEGMINREASIKITLTGGALDGITTDNWKTKPDELYNAAIQHLAPGETGVGNQRLGDYFDKSNGGYTTQMSASTSGGAIVSATYTFTFDYYTNSTQEAEVLTKVNEIYAGLSLTNGGYTEQQKVFLIYDWITNNVSYDYDNLNNADNKTKYTAYGALHDGKAVCQGFACLFYRMCIDNGIDCRIVTGTSKGEGHAWNIVRVDGQYYYVDATWDCKVPVDNGKGYQPKPGTLFYFLRNDISSDHTETNGVSAGLAVASKSLSGFAVNGGVVTDLCGNALDEAENAWYNITITGTGCDTSVKITPAAVGLTDIVLLETNGGSHNFDINGFCKNCSSGYQPAVQNTSGAYAISNAGQLYWFAQQVNSGNTGINAELTANITINTDVLKPDGTIADDTSGFRSWTLIGNNSNIYTGTFDGQNHIVSGLYFNDTNTIYVSLFGNVGNGGEVSNVGVVDSYFKGGSSSVVGGVCGLNEGTIKNCYNDSSVNGGDYSIVGGVCGDNYGTIQNCYNTGTVSGGVYNSGVCGRNYSTIVNSYNTGAASGGVCESNEGTITNCYYLADTETDEFDGTTAKTAGEFASGEVAYLLQGEQEEAVWGQTIGTDDYPVLGGDKVYRVDKYEGCEGAPGSASADYSNTNASIYSEHNYTSGGICTYCSALENGKDGFYSVSLTLTDGVAINYYMLLSEEALADTGAYIHFTSEQGLDKKIMLSDHVIKNEKYKFSLELRPDQMADEITAQVVYSDSTSGRSLNYSVKKFAANIPADNSSRALADAMLKFGAFTQLYTGRNTDDLVTAVSDYETNASIPDTYNFTLDSNLSGISVKAATLFSGAYTSIRVKYQLSEGANISDYTFKCGDTVLTPEQSGDYYYVYLRNIRPQNLDEMYSFTVSDGTNTTTFTYSAYTYMKNVFENTEAYGKPLVNLMNAMYYYNKAANEYVG